MKYIADLKILNLPSDDFAVFGSGPLAVRGLRVNEDIDVIVKPGLWKKLILLYPHVSEKLISLNHLEIFENWLPWFSDVNKLIDTADIFDNIKYVKLEHVLAWKKAANREKDFNDIFLLEGYLNMKKQS